MTLIINKRFGLGWLRNNAKLYSILAPNPGASFNSRFSQVSLVKCLFLKRKSLEEITQKKKIQHTSPAKSNRNKSILLQTHWYLPMTGIKHFFWHYHFWQKISYCHISINIYVNINISVISQYQRKMSEIWLLGRFCANIFYVFNSSECGNTLSLNMASDLL